MKTEYTKLKLKHTLTESLFGGLFVYHYSLTTTEPIYKDEVFVKKEIPETISEFISLNELNENDVVEFLNKNYTF